MSRYKAVSISVLAALAIAACSNGDAQPSDTSAEQSSETTASSDDVPSLSLSAMLESVPDTPETRRDIVYGNLSVLRERSGIGPGDSALDDARALNPSLPGWFVADPFTRLLTGSDEAEFGFALNDVDASLMAGRVPARVSVFRGRIDASALDEALRTFEPFAEDMTREQQGDMTVYRFANADGPDLERTTSGRPLGVSQQIATNGKSVWLADSDAALDDVLLAATGERDSLADFEPLRKAVAAVEDADADFIVASAVPFAFDQSTLVLENLGDGPPDPDELRETYKEYAAQGLRPWLAAAAGERFGDGPVDEYEPGNRDTVIALSHADADAASANAETLERTLGEGISVDDGRPWSQICASSTVTVDGTLVMATCEGSRSAGDIFTIRDLIYIV